MSFSYVISFYILCIQYIIISFSIYPIYTLGHQQFLLCESIFDCLTCSFRMYEYAHCEWNTKIRACRTVYDDKPYEYQFDLKAIYSTCQSTDYKFIEKVSKYCPKFHPMNTTNSIIEGAPTIEAYEIVFPGSNKKNYGYNYINKTYKNINLNYDDYYIENNTKNEKTEDISNIDDLNQIKSTIDTNEKLYNYSTSHLLCRYIVSQNKSGSSNFQISIKKRYMYINVYVEFRYSMISRHINLKSEPNFNITTAGVKEALIYIYTPEGYIEQPYTIEYRFIIFKPGITIYILIGITCIVSIIFLIILISLFYYGLKLRKPIHHSEGLNFIKDDRLSFIKENYNNNIYIDYNSICPICSETFNEKQKVTLIECKHLYHYNCLNSFVKEHKLRKSNFFCILCRNIISEKKEKEEIEEIEDIRVKSQISGVNVNLESLWTEKEYLVNKTK